MVMTRGTARSVNFCQFLLRSLKLCVAVTWFVNSKLETGNTELAFLAYDHHVSGVYVFQFFTCFLLTMLTTSCLISVCLVLGSRLVFPSLSVGFSFFFTWCIRGYSLLGVFNCKKIFFNVFFVKNVLDEKHAKICQKMQKHKIK